MTNAECKAAIRLWVDRAREMEAKAQMMSHGYHLTLVALAEAYALTLDECNECRGKGDVESLMATSEIPGWALNEGITTMIRMLPCPRCTPRLLALCATLGIEPSNNSAQ